jgi:hypothetical protein
LPLLAEIPIKIDLRQAGDDGAALGSGPIKLLAEWMLD